MPYQLLIVEDDAKIIQALTEELNQAFGDEMDVRDCNFKEALDRVRTLRPDIMILDQHEGVAEDAARPIWDYIWEKHFCPLIVYSAFDFAGYGSIDHPFSHYEAKGAAGSLGRVIEKARGFFEQADGLRTLRYEIDDRIADSLKFVSPLVWREPANVAQRSDLLRRVTRRRLAASFDSPSCLADNVIALEQFIYPPLEPGLLTGDVIKSVDANSSDASAFSLVLTPSCDLQSGGTRHPVSSVLVAHCIGVNDPDILRLFDLNADAKDLPEKLGRRLKSDKLQHMCVIPQLQNVWPAMVANLKKLTLVAREEIALDESVVGGGTPFVRLASLDSPFRESLAWRYTQTTGRPGLPDLDEAVLERDIIAAAKTLMGADRAGN